MRTVSTLGLVLLLGLSLPTSALAAMPGVLVPTPSPAWKPASASAAVIVNTDRTEDKDAGAITNVDVVLVSGQYTGPGLWRVSKGDHTLWILGTVSPVPKGMDWYSPQAESVLAQAKEIIGAPGFSSSVGAGGMFKMAFAMPTMLRALRNPDGESLRDVLPPDLYARWHALKPLYLGNDRSVELWRPVFASGKLYQGALKRSGLVNGTGVGKRIGEAAKARKIKWTSTMIRTDIKDPKGLAKSLARADIDDVACFRSVLDRLELDVANAAERANAWATGDMAALARLFRHGDVTPCFEAVANTEAAHSLGAGDAVARGKQLWLEAAEAALLANHTSFSTLPVAELLQSDGLLARLQAKGYSVVVPDQAAALPTPSTQVRSSPCAAPAPPGRTSASTPPHGCR